MAARLIEPGAEGQPAREIPIPGEEFLIGRGADCDLRLALVDISRHHCLIRLRGGEPTVTDLGSSNGTFVNGQRIRSPATLRSGDEIRVGDCRFLLDLGDKPELRLAGGADPMAATFKMRPKKS